MSSKSKPLIITALLIIAIVAFIFFQNKDSNSKNSTEHSNSQNNTVVIAYQTGVDPTKVAQANGDYEKNSQHQISWKKFDTGADVVNALASGDVNIGNIGSSPLSAAASQNVPIEVFLITARLGSSEALVVQQQAAIHTPADLKGKTIAVPFVSTAHYSLLSALKHWDIASSELKIVNLRPPEISAAWERGDIDAAYVWEPALSKISATGKVLTNSAQVAEWGSPTFDVWVVRKDFAQKNPEFIQSFVQTSLAKIDEYNAHPEAFQNDPQNIEKISKLTGSAPQDIPLLLAGNQYLSKTQNAALFASEFAKNIFDTARFLKSQGKVDKLKANYDDAVTSRFVQQ